MDFGLLQCVVGPFGNVSGCRNQRDLTALLYQQFREHAAHIIVIVVVDRDVARRDTARHQIIRRIDWHCCVHRDRDDMLARNTIGAPVRTRRNTDVLETELQNLCGVEGAIEIGFHIRFLRKLVLSIIRHAPPCRQTGE